jgi:hypothetical protein
LRAEILRIEMLLQGLTNEKPRKISVNSAGLAISAIWRLHKLSGHINDILKFPETKPFWKLHGLASGDGVARFSAPAISKLAYFSFYASPRLTKRLHSRETDHNSFNAAT